MFVLLYDIQRFALMLPQWLEAIVNDTTTIITKIGARKNIPTELAKQFKVNTCCQTITATFIMGFMPIIMFYICR
jgi:hypothetical protein